MQTDRRLLPGSEQGSGPRRRWPEERIVKETEKEVKEEELGKKGQTLREEGTRHVKDFKRWGGGQMWPKGN